MLPGVGVFGTGEIANVLVPLLREKSFEVKAIWGRTLREAKETANALGVTFYTNVIDEVLLRKDVDLVFIVCQPFLHAEISVKALGIGKHVVCDKPAGLHQIDSMKMVRASQYYPTLISLVNHPLRFLPAFTQMRRCLQDELIGPMGDVVLMDVRVQMGTLFPEKYNWMCDAQMGGGALNLVGSVVDLVNFLLQQQAVRVHGVLRAHTKTTAAINGIRQITAPDFCNFQMELASGTLVTVALHTYCHLVVRGGDLFVLKESQQKEEAVYVDVQDLHFNTNNSLLPRTYIKGMCKMVGALKEAFNSKESSWIKAPVSTAATFEDGLYVHAVVEAIRKSNETRQWQRVQLSTDAPLNHDQIIRYGYARMSTM
ncbi:GH25259 [Drosophila grimshawi]|uniref:GH25259 n=1 Tax=Drosophila grimshawi TaxID=7222 RepID=B4K1R3_DROGR|nr:GH25259 [Drosophila grimshawi]